QVSQVVKELQLKLDKEKFFSRCSICNIYVQPIEKHNVKDKVPQYVYNIIDEFFYCPECNRIYWQGSHYTLFLEEVEKNLKK
ncbi:MAG: Mut7-C RNAse domain-containing protein, partial [Endomicrobia bacterium]|nr:Mut7-C RNAse domain-containing protein [Endomicrobiia bacterium]